MDLLLTALLLLSLAAWLYLPRAIRRTPGTKLPPGPTPLPILGNILSLGTNPHKSLARLAHHHGPVMLLRLGTLNTVVISSAESARAVLQKQDQAFCNRPTPEAVRALDHHRHSVVWMPAGHQWRKLRKLCKEKMFSAQKLDASHGLRIEKLQQLIDHVDDCCASGQAVDVGRAAFTTSLNLMWASLFSVDVAEFGSDRCREFREIVNGIMAVIGKPNLADYFPILRAVDPQGIFRHNTVYFEKCFAVFNEMIDRRMEMRRAGDRTVWNDMLEALLEANREDESGLTFDDIRHLLLDLFVASSDTTSGTVEWAMTELIRNPKKMSKAKFELKNILNPNEQVQESDIAKLPYLQAVVKETFRIHPIVPLVFRKAEEDTELNGYIIPKNSQILVNIWAIGRDPNVWQDPDMFMPKRFLDKEINFNGQHFELMPFGGGRRICVGLPLAHRMIHLMLASLIRNFEWKLEEGVKCEEMDMTGRFGISVQKAIPLKIIPLKV